MRGFAPLNLLSDIVLKFLTKLYVPRGTLHLIKIFNQTPDPPLI